MPSLQLEKTKTPGIFKRGNRYVVVYRDPGGRQRKRFARTMAEARDVKAGLRADVTRGEYRAVSRVTFAEYAATWIDEYAGRTSRGLRGATRDDYRKRLEQDAIPFFGRIRLVDVGPRDVKQFAAHVASRGVAPNTVRLALAPVRALFATAYEEGVIRSNPAAGLRLAQTIAPAAGDADEAHVKALAEEELGRLLDKLPAEWRLFFEFLAHTGLRISEAIALRWRDVELGERRLSVRRRFYRGSFAAPKSRYGQRTIPLTPGLARSLWELRKTAGAVADDGLVFPSEVGTVIDSSNLASRVLKPAARKAGVGWAGFHTLRHTCATILFRHGLNAKQVQAWMGHHSPAFTLATYVHLLPEDLPDPGFLDDLMRATPSATTAPALVAEAGA